MREVDISIGNSDGIPKMKRQEAEGCVEVAVLISRGYGAGWSTWNQEHRSILLFHKDIVKFILDNPVETCVDANAWDESLKALVLGLTGDDYVYTGGAEDLEVVWLPEGSAFIVTEYDGAEWLRTIESYDWDVA